MSASIDTDAGWSAYEKISAELNPSALGDRLSVLMSAIALVGFAVVLVLAYIPDGAA